MNNILKFLSNFLTVQNSADKTFPTEDHLKSGIDWLKKAQDATLDDGVASVYHLYKGWLPSYPETTGYIIETLLDYYYLTRNEDLRNRAVKMADWLMSLAFKDGSFPDIPLTNKMVFDTGQIIFGLVRAFEETKEIKYKNAAIRAGEWLLSEQEVDGSWIKNAYNNIPHTYYSRVAWSLLEVHKLTKEEKFLIGNKKNISWVLSKQLRNGWFKNASFTDENHKRPFTHTIAYTIRGVLESGIYLDNKDYILSAEKAIKAIINRTYKNGYISGTFDFEWKEASKFSCLTGNAQLAIILFKLAEITSNEEYLIRALALNMYLKKKQFKTKNQNINGAISGSYPIWGKYIHYALPNWATKFFCDALLMETKIN